MKPLWRSRAVRMVHVAGAAFVVGMNLAGAWGHAQTLDARVQRLEADLRTAQQAIAMLADLKIGDCMRVEWIDPGVPAKGKRLVVQNCKVVLMNADTTVKGDLTVSEGDLFVQNGLGQTETANGKGNLIIGYNEGPQGLQRGGSHNLVIGTGHTYSSVAGLVAGKGNSVTRPYSSVTGGTGNSAEGDYSVVTGGEDNKARGAYSAVSGGKTNISLGLHASVLGGISNLAQGGLSSVVGGNSNSSLAATSVVLGGISRSAPANQPNGLYPRPHKHGDKPRWSANDIDNP